MIKYTEEQKYQILQEVKTIGNIKLVARRNNVPDSTIHTWLKKLKQSSFVLDLESAKEIKKLKQQLLDKELENKILKDLLKKTYQVWQSD